MNISEKLFKELCTLNAARLDVKGREWLNPKPLVLDVDPVPVPLQAQLKRLLRQNLSMEAAKQGLETWEESQDFDVEDDEVMFPTSIHEMQEELPFERPAVKAGPEAKAEGKPSAGKEPTKEEPLELEVDLPDKK